MPMFIGELSGARVLQVGVGVTDALPLGSGTTAVLADATTHDVYPAGEGGACVFRGLAVTFRHDQGYALGVTPIVDGVALTEQLFTGASPAAGTDGVTTIRAGFAARGERCSCRVRQTAATGLFEFVSVSAFFYVVREAP